MNEETCATVGEYREFVLNTIRGHAPKQDLHISPAIPQKKEQGARSSCSIPENQQILALIDCTVMGSAKNCLAFTDVGIYWHSDSSGKTPGAFSVQYTDFAPLTFEEAGKYELSLGDGKCLNTVGCSCPRDMILKVLNAIKIKAGGKDEIAEEESAPGTGLRFLMGTLLGSDIPILHRGLALFDPTSKTVRVALFIELRANDALKTSPVKHGLTMLWDDKGAQVAERAGEKVPGVGGGGVMVSGWLAGRALGSLAQGLLQGDQPEVIVQKIRTMAPSRAEKLIGHIMDALEKAGCVKTYSFEQVSRSADDQLGHSIYFAKERTLTYTPADGDLIPSEIKLLDTKDTRYAEELDKRRKNEQQQKALLIGMLVFVVVIVFVVPLVVKSH